MKQIQSELNKITKDELSEKDLELVIGGIMSEVVIRETMENINNFGTKIEQINEKVKK